MEAILVLAWHSCQQNHGEQVYFLYNKLKLVKSYFGTMISVDREDNVTYTDNYSLIFISFYSITGQNIETLLNSLIWYPNMFMHFVLPSKLPL